MLACGQAGPPGGGGGSASPVANIINHQHHQSSSISVPEGLLVRWKVCLIGTSLLLRSHGAGPDRGERSWSAFDDSQRLTTIRVSADVPDHQSAADSRHLGYRRSLQIPPREETSRDNRESRAASWLGACAEGRAGPLPAAKWMGFSGCGGEAGSVGE